MIWCWVVGFCPGEAWSTRWLRRGYGHCWAARPLWDDVWLWIEWTPGRVIAGPVPLAMVELAIERATEVFNVDTVPGQRDHCRPWPVFGWWHCVRLVVDVLGFRMPWWPTPWGFARALRARAVPGDAMGHENAENPRPLPG